ncbi:MAG: hypothetical protein JO257_36370 [Deltaproteobacteria bacterium]|nr:hypothetical protein [Deltaproteobacteria bacterium]
MLKIMVVDKLETRRAELVDAICELPGVEAHGAPGFLDALKVMTTERMDAVMLGTLPDSELRQLGWIANNVLHCAVAVVEDAGELVMRTEAMLVERRRKREDAYATRAARIEALALARASGGALAHRLRVAQREPGAQAGMQTLVLQDWLPALCTGFARMMPAYVELVPVISAGTPAVRAIPEILEHEMFDIVLEAAAKLPWGGTIWLTAELASDDTVRIDVLENGRGTGDDVTLRTAAPVSS